MGTGRLQLLVSVPRRSGLSDSAVQFRDGRVPLKRQMELILTYLLGLPQRAAEEREARRREDEARLAALRAERERRRQEKLACREALHDLARQWERMERLRAYLDALDQMLLESEVAGTEDYRVWRRWATDQLAATPRWLAAQVRSWATRVAELTRWEPLP